MNIRTIRKSKRGFTLVELMIVVAIVGVLAALAIYGVRRYVLNAKTAEARNSIGQLGKDASTAYSREGMAADVLVPGTSTGVTNRLCGSSTAIPSDPAFIAGKKYQSNQSDWSAGSQTAGWQCLRFSMQDPQFFQYQYTASATTGTEGDHFEADAHGDLDGNLTLSTFELSGKIVKDSVSGALGVTLAPNIKETSPDE